MNVDAIKLIIGKVARISLLYFLVIVVSLIGIGMIAFFFGMPEYTASGNANNTFIIDLPFDKAKKVLMQKTAVEEIVTYNGGKLIDRNITSIKLSSDKLFHGWEADMTGNLTIQVFPPGLGSMILHLDQKAHVMKDNLESVTTLATPSGHLQSVYSKLEMIGQGGQTRVDMRIQIVYSRRIPFFLKKFMERKLQEGAETVLKKNQAAILNLMNKPVKKWNFQVK